ncbi:MAG TPA: AmmeMemoRadiSam system protein A [Dongiaceae bacterium]|nr:AmmeMemoRadiSam system protein A [Dongiaceae bacterium]
MIEAGGPPPLTEAEGRALLQTARAAILAVLGERPGGTPAAPPQGLEARHPVFVTLHVAGRLRGCIGTLSGTEPLRTAVADCARAAAFEDPRFAPLGKGEVQELTLEISVLGPRRPLADPAALRLGEEGLVVTSGGRSGLLLPQVATEQGWDVVEFLEATCRKAGLPLTAWRDGARVERFAAQVFRECAERSS